MHSLAKARNDRRSAIAPMAQMSDANVGELPDNTSGETYTLWLAYGT